MGVALARDRGQREEEGQLGRCKDPVETERAVDLDLGHACEVVVRGQFEGTILSIVSTV